MADSDLISLYSGRILALASAIPHLGTLADADVTIRQRAPRCGSMLTAEVAFEADRISALGLDVKACALGQAAASAIAAKAIGQDRASVVEMRDALAAMLSQDGPPPGPPFEMLEVLIPARDYPNRHGSIMLLANALVAAFDEAKSPASC